MKKISPIQIAVFAFLFGAILALAVATTSVVSAYLPSGDFRGIEVLVIALIFIYLYAFAVYRAFLKMVPLEEGVVEPGTRAELAAQVNILFYLILFNSLIRTNFLPVPLTRLIYLALGARLGENTYSAGALLDPPLTEIGNNCIIGHNAALFCHAIEGQNFSLSRIKIGDNVTIGAMAIVMSGVVIEEGAIVSAGAVVKKGSYIGAGEIWGGVPARRIT
ncbi:acyltransferase [Methylomonas koyamae]|uniref:acyltransferase n=1 Tax=Methylomonas koyamae TaxID=702114 RepID=UPI002873D69B|nr:DapH/DapD/GlmU-related protein [Methylomonas koyamae]WNB77252.1 DapH/DapD/GlmU-related protein [Methylomonas koyamae]